MMHGLTEIKCCRDDLVVQDDYYCCLSNLSFAILYSFIIYYQKKIMQFAESCTLTYFNTSKLCHLTVPETVVKTCISNIAHVYNLNYFSSYLPSHPGFEVVLACGGTVLRLDVLQQICVGLVGGIKAQELVVLPVQFISISLLLAGTNNVKK